MAVFALDEDFAEQWNTIAFASGRMVHRPAVATVPQGIAIVTTVLGAASQLEVLILNEHGKSLSRGKTKVSPTNQFSITAARQSNLLVVFTVVEANDDVASRRVFAIALPLK